MSGDTAGAEGIEVESPRHSSYMMDDWLATCDAMTQMMLVANSTTSRSSAESSNISCIPLTVCDSELLKSYIAGHPTYPELVKAHMDCHKIGAPANLVAQMEELMEEQLNDIKFKALRTSIGINPELDQFMVAYRDVLRTYESEMGKAFEEAVIFCKELEQQLSLVSDSKTSLVSAEEYEEFDRGDLDFHVNPHLGDKELRQMLMKKYGTFIKGLTQEHLKRKKKGKLPKQARFKLLEWWSDHQEHPYPTEQQKVSLGEVTGLDAKQISNWFINQRKRHWNPASRQENEEMVGESEKNPKLEEGDATAVVGLPIEVSATKDQLASPPGEVFLSLEVFLASCSSVRLQQRHCNQEQPLQTRFP